jgi:hypothetical protein
VAYPLFQNGTAIPKSIEIEGSGLVILLIETTPTKLSSANTANTKAVDAFSNGLLELVPSYWINHCLTRVAYAVTPEMRNQLCFYLPKDPFTEYRRADWCRPTYIDLQMTGICVLPK